jgi:hypothetical protein
MNYICVKWHHDIRSEPVLLYSELDESRWEHRKIEVYADGRHDFCSAVEIDSASKLSKEPLPTLAEIGADPQFSPREISKEEFERVWALR